MVDMEKSVRILTSALTWFLKRTVPSSRKAKPECIASTRIAPSSTNSTSEPDLNASISHFLPRNIGDARELCPISAPADPPFLYNRRDAATQLPPAVRGFRGERRGARAGGRRPGAPLRPGAAGGGGGR